MRLRQLPLAKPRPNAQEFLQILGGKTQGGRTPLVEYIVDDVVMKPIVTNLLDRDWVEWGPDRASQRAYLDNVIQFWYRMGYDVVRYELSLNFAENKLMIPDPAPGSEKMRGWVDEHHGTITSWKEFEAYAWPSVPEFDFFPFEYLNDNLPEGMGLVSCHGGGVFEHLSWMMSFEGLCSALKKDPDLVEAVSRRLGESMRDFYRNLLDLEKLVAVFPGDDMGYNVTTLISPTDLKTYILPWHREFASMAHAKGLPYYLHSCGNLEKIMEDLISDVRIDAKHSFEDNIIPVSKFQEQYGDQIAVLGGMDLNILGISSEEEIRRKTRSLVEICGSRGRYAVGSGNSIPSYIPYENFLAMVDEALDLNAGGKMS